MRLFNRRYELTVRQDTAEGQDLVTLTDHRIVFEVIQTNTNEPDRLECTIYNPTESTEQAFQRNAHVTLSAGYTNDETYGILFSGFVRRVTTLAENMDNKLTFVAFDNDRAYNFESVNISFQPGTPLTDVLNHLFDNLGDVKTADAKKALESIQDIVQYGAQKHNTILSAKVFKKGLSLHGKTASYLRSYFRRTSPRLRWVIQSGELVVARENLAVAQAPTAIELDPTTGLIGSPKIGERGNITVKSLLQPHARPFRQVKMAATRSVNGFYAIKKATHSGDTRSNDWFSTLEAVKI